jgi:hypothetical protein
MYTTLPLPFHVPNSAASHIEQSHAHMYKHKHSRKHKYKRTMLLYTKEFTHTHKRSLRRPPAWWIIAIGEGIYGMQHQARGLPGVLSG